MINIHEQILDYLKQLYRPTMRGCYQQIADCARSESFSYEQYLLDLLKVECEERISGIDIGLVATRVGNAGFKIIRH